MFEVEQMLAIIEMQQKINKMTMILRYLADKYGTDSKMHIPESDLEKYNTEEGGIAHNNMEKESYHTLINFSNDAAIEKYTKTSMKKHMDECTHNPKNKMEEKMKDIDKLSSLLSQLKNLVEKNKS